MNEHAMTLQPNPLSAPKQELRLAVSLKTLAALLDADRSSIRRWLKDSNINPVVLGRGRNGAIRYRWRDIEAWLDSREELG